MELVPILSTIILVGTIATFILAVAAYILYKIREGRARDATTHVGYMQPQEPHVLVAPEGSVPLQPAPASMYVAPGVQQAPVQSQPQQQLQQPPQGQNPNSLFWEYTDEGFVPVNPQQETPPRARQQQQPQAPQQDEGYAWL